jgi:glycosyltransferase involved in cell wall biosynthesis
MTSISVVVPVYRSEKTLPELHARLKAVLQKISKDYEILFVDDHSGDGSWEVVRGLAQKNKHVGGIRLSKNFGQHAATLCGISRSRGEWIVTLDDDLEHQPEFIPALFNKIKEGYDLVYGVYDQRSNTWWRNFTSKMARFLFQIAIPSLNFEYTSFRIIRRETALALSQFDSPFPFVDGYLSWATNYYTTVSIDHGNRIQGKSNYSFGKLLAHTINIFVTFSDLPLRLAAWIGIISFVAGFSWLSVIVYQRLFGEITVTGYTSLMAALITFNGIQFFILGVFGSYLGRINFKTSKKPLFLVGEVKGCVKK